MDGSFNEVGHSQAAIYLLNQYKIKSGDEVDLNGNICNGNVSNGISIGNLKEKPVSNGFSKEFKSDESLEVRNFEFQPFRILIENLPSAPRRLEQTDGLTNPQTGRKL